MNNENFTPYDANMPPVFFGYYWLTGHPSVQSKNAVCVDYSVAKDGGKLCCYSFNNSEKNLQIFFVLSTGLRVLQIY